MNKRALFLSVAITTFILAMVGGVFSVYQAFASTGSPVAQVQSVSQVTFPTTAIDPTVPAIQQLTPEQAAAIAAAYINRQDVYAVESDVLDTVTVYKVIFSSGIVVYVGLDGQILRVENPANYSVSQSSQSSAPLIITEHSADDEPEHEEDD
jgi:lipid-binding SYLF domain-containing protein